MTRTIVAILALAPAMLIAQTTTPAQPSSTPILHAALLQPAALALKAVETPRAGSTPVRISTGVVAPKLVHSVNISVDAAGARLTAADLKVVVDMTVDETGKPTDLKIAQSADQTLDQNVLAAVSQFRYLPGTLNGEPTAVPVHLQVTISRGTAY